MNDLDRAVADLREVDAQIRAHTPLEELENKRKIAEGAVLAAARSRSQGDEPAAVVTISTQFPEDEVEISGDQDGVETIADGDAEPAASAAGSGGGATKVAIADRQDSDRPVMLDDAVEHVGKAVAESTVIDSTEEVSLEEALEASEPTKDPNGFLGVNYPRDNA